MNLYEELKPIAKEKRENDISEKAAKYITKIRKGLIENAKKGELYLHLRVPNDVEIIKRMNIELEKDGFDLVTLGLVGIGSKARGYVSPIVDLKNIKLNNKEHVE